MKHSTVLRIISIGIMLGTCLTQFAHSGRWPEIDEPGLWINAPTIDLHQSDFNSGTYRIQQPGYYRLAQNITFSPDPVAETKRKDKPLTGWFAAISVECDNVIIDLNTKTLEVAESMLTQHAFKVFSLIELGNSPFEHFLFTYVDNKTLSFAKNITVKNGALGRSPHHGIHGNRNANVYLYDLTIRDWEVSAIALNGLQSGHIQHISITGNTHVIPFTSIFTLLNVTRVDLESLIKQGDRTAQRYLDALQTVIKDDSQNGFMNPGNRHDGNCYGIYLHRTFDIGPMAVHSTDKTSNCVLIEDVDICNIKASIIETVGMADMNNQLIKAEVFGIPRWIDAYPNGTFAPSPLLKAQIYVLSKRDEGRPPSAKKLPEGLAEAILSTRTNEALFLKLVKPVFNIDDAGHANKGIFGIRVDGGHSITLRNCTIMGLENKSELGQELKDIVQGDQYNTPPTRYTGSDVYGISFAASHNCSIYNCVVQECRSDNGYIFGISLKNDVTNTRVVNCCSNDHRAHRDENSSVTNLTNPPSRVIGFFVDNGSNANQIIGCETSSSICPRFTYGFLVHNSAHTLFKECHALACTITSTHSPELPKRAYGFTSQASDYTVFDQCETRGFACIEENTALASATRVAGFALEETQHKVDTAATILSCCASSLNGGSGIASGISLNGSVNALIENNKIYHNSASGTQGKAYGIETIQGPDSNTLIIRNESYHNQTENYHLPPSSIPIEEQVISGSTWINRSL